MKRLTRQPKPGDWVLLAFARQTNRIVHVAQIVSLNSHGYWLRFPRNPEACWFAEPVFNTAFISTLTGK